jgi:hypothetical protein
MLLLSLTTRTFGLDEYQISSTTHAQNKTSVIMQSPTQMSEKTIKFQKTASSLKIDITPEAYEYEPRLAHKIIHT